MEMKLKLIIFGIFLTFLGNAQLIENFSDGNFTSNPTWTGTTADFFVNSNFELQTNTTVAATSYLSVPHGLTNLDGKEWRMRVKMTFSPSTSNFGRIYLAANNSDPTTNPDGFYIQLGEAGSTDAVRLFKQVGGTSSLICSGLVGAIANTFNFGIKVTRDNAGLWSLSTDANGGTNYVFQANGTDSAPLLGSHFIWQCTYTVSNATKFFLDDVYVGNIIFDNTAPILLSATAIDQNHVDVLFNESLEPTVVQVVNNYDIQPFNSVSQALLDVSNPRLIHLTTTLPLQNGNTYTLFVLYMEDVSGNDTANQSTLFTYIIPEPALPGDVIINEIFADPTPVIGLPELEFVEIYNRSNKYLDLTGWKLADASADGTISAGILAPNEYKVLCATSSAPSFQNSVGVSSFPSLNNAGDDVVLKDTNGLIIDKIVYTDGWYQNEIKKDGGYTLERINPLLICSSNQNWIGSNSSTGGTPGIQNSVFNNTPDVTPPTLKIALAQTPNVLTIEFSEPMDETALQLANFTVLPTLTETNRVLNGPQPTQMSLFFSQNLLPSTSYSFTLSGIEDCAGNATNLTGTFILPDNPVANDVVINEILFDPLTGGSDYVELYNASNKVFDVYQWKLANVAGDSVANKKAIASHFLIFPGEYVVVTKDTNNVKLNYPVHQGGRFVMSDLPTYNNDSGTVILLTDFVELDRVSYQDDWHFALLDTKDGKALERINAFDKSNNPNNWHTAAEAVRFGTPGLENSQFVPLQELGELFIPNKVFSPDNDGHEDVLQIRYKLSESEMLANIQIYDDYGRLVRKLKENEYLGTEGVFTWDGVNDTGTKASIGQYIVVFEAFQPNGAKKFGARKVCILAGKL